jgi:hypothetical protein
MKGTSGEKGDKGSDGLDGSPGKINYNINILIKNIILLKAFLEPLERIMRYDLNSNFLKVDKG